MCQTEVKFIVVCVLEGTDVVSRQRRYLCRGIIEGSID
jgi:hypothetical protein